MLARTETPLKRLLVAEGRTQAWLGRQVGADQSQVNRWVHGLHEPVQQTKDAISDALGVPTSELWPAEPEQVAA